MSSAKATAEGTVGPLGRILKSSVGNKVLMAVSGLGLVGFIVAHLSGNLLVFAGPEAMNSYAKGLRAFPSLLWGARFGLLACAVIHVVTAIRLTRQNRAARPEGYRRPGRVQTTLGSRTMVLTGLLLLAYAIYHLAHFTWGLTDPDIAAAHANVDAYSMVVIGFQKPLVVVTYVIANALLGLHLSHGIASMFQTVGLTNATYQPILEKLGVALAILLTLGFLSIPIAAFAGLLPLPA
jgi:succinate dehydrogenase / fumarate reductase cytochrome b subunit